MCRTCEHSSDLSASSLTMYVTYLAAKRVTSTQQFYAAGRSVSGIQNGWAIAGDYLSAASFLASMGIRGGYQCGH